MTVLQSSGVQSSRVLLVFGLLTISQLFLWPSVVLAQGCQPDVQDTNKSILWGDLHIHTSFSMDAYVWNNQVTPEQAYDFARGGLMALGINDENAAAAAIETEGRKLLRPLDFAAITDHAEYFAVINECQVRGLPTAYCKELNQVAAEESTRGFYELFLPALLRNDKLCQGSSEQCITSEKALWQRTIDAANAANEPCKFTALVANEWTASPDNLHWHRNLIYATDTVPARAINSFDEPDQTDMWQALTERCADVPGCDVLAIPHNSNIGMGGSFDISGHSRAQLEQRARFEKLVEIHQHKGNSECFAGSTLSDEACDFETMLPIPLIRSLAEQDRPLTELERKEVSTGYVRDTLARGLAVEVEQGVNPFVYGFVGANRHPFW